MFTPPDLSGENCSSAMNCTWLAQTIRRVPLHRNPVFFLGQHYLNEPDETSGHHGYFFSCNSCFYAACFFQHFEHLGNIYISRNGAGEVQRTISPVFYLHIVPAAYLPHYGLNGSPVELEGAVFPGHYFLQVR